MRAASLAGLLLLGGFALSCARVGFSSLANASDESLIPGDEDNADGASSDSASDADVPPPSPPTGLSLLTPASSPAFDATPVVQITGTESGCTVELYADASCTVLLSSGLATGSTLNVTSTTLTVGPHTLYAAQRSAEGGRSACSTATVQYTVAADPADTLPLALVQSVGINAAALLSGTGLSVVGNIAEFAGQGEGSFPGNVGVGDVIVYGSSYAVIKGLRVVVDGARAFVTLKDGESAPDAATQTSFTVFRAFTSLSAWAAQTQSASITPSIALADKDLTDSDDEGGPLFVACYADGEDTNALNIDATWVRGASQPITVFTPFAPEMVGASQRHSGRLDGTGFAVSGPGQYVHNINGPHVFLDGLVLQSVATTDTLLTLYGGTGTGDVKVSNVIFDSRAGASEGVCNRNAGTQLRLIITNTYFVGSRYRGAVHACAGAGDVLVVNSTFVDNSPAGIASDSGAVVAINNLMSANTPSFSGTFGAGSDYNVSSDATSTGGAHDVVNATITFAAADDVHLDPTDVAARGAGSGPASETRVPEFDLDGDARSGATCNAGADE